MVLIVFSADSIEGFLINGSLIGFGLVIAIYTLTIPKMKDILNRRTRKLRDLIKQREEIFEAMREDKRSTTLTAKYQSVQRNIKSLEKLPFHLDIGYYLSATLFAISLLVPLFTITFPTIKYSGLLLVVSFMYFSTGIIIFLALWFILFIELRNYAMEEFEKVKEESEKKEKVIFGGKIKETLSDKIITLRRDSDGVLRGYDKNGKRKI